MEKSIFKRIIDREIPADIVYEDALCLAFEDANPQAPTHLLIIPKKEIKSLDDISAEDESLLGHLQLVIRDLAREFELIAGGYRVITNCGAGAGQTVFHLHYHLLSCPSGLPAGSA
jgi:histidine triad (HIT) family protein